MSKTYVIGSREFGLWEYRGYWYAVWRDDAGKKRRRSMKTGDRKLAESRLEELARELDREKRPTFGTYAASLLLPDDPYVKQKSVSRQTVYAKRRAIEILTEWFGADELGETREKTIERRLDRSGYKPSYQQSLMDAYTYVMRQAKRDGYDVRLPEFVRPDRNVTRRDSLTPAEVRALFPDKIEEIKKLYDEGDDYGLMFGLLYRTIVHGGLRPGEGRAVGRSQFYPEHHALVVSRRLDRQNQPQELKKRRYGDSDVFRIVVLPARTVELLAWWIETTEPQDYLFTYNREPVRQRYISERWSRVLDRVKVGEDEKPLDREGRVLDVHSLRTTYRSMTEGWLSRAFLLDAMGHRSADVHDGYLRFLERQVEAAGKNAAAVDEAWDIGVK